MPSRCEVWSAAACGVFVMLWPDVLSAQDTAATCPGITADASLSEQIVCWSALDARTDSACHGGACIGRVRTLCENAPLDIPAVGHACFLANIRSGDLNAAVGLVDYLQEPTAEVARCRDAVTSVAQLRIVSNPIGAQLRVDGVDYGVAPVVVTLKSPWWEHRIEATFGTGVDATLVPVAAVALLNAFDARACAMGDLVVAGPPPPVSPPPPPVVPVPSAAPTTFRPLLASATPPLVAAQSDRPSYAWVWTLVGSGIAGGAALAFGWIGERQYQTLKDRCAPNCSSDEISASGVATSDALTVGFGVGAGVLGVLTVILAVNAGSADAAPVQATLSPHSVQLTGRF